MKEFEENNMSQKIQQKSEADVLQQVDTLAKDIAPNRDLWPGIEQAINNAPQHREYEKSWSSYSKIAASFAPIALVLGLWLGPNLMADNEQNTEQLFSSIAAGFDIQKRQLLIQVSDQPTAVENWQESLKELEQAEKALIKALQSQPEDPALMKMLYQVYQQQLELIQTAHKPELASKFRQI